MSERLRRSYASTRILVAEDSPTQREHIKFLLEENGVEVTVAENGRQALDLVTADPPDLIISDVMMPEMNGFELCRAIRTNPDLKNLAVILVTGLSSPTDVFLGLESGADNFITKPYDERYLLSRIDYILANRELRKVGKLEVGIEIELAGERHFITAERQQILDLLVSTYEQAVRLNEEVRQGQDLLNQSYDTLNALFRVAEGIGTCQSEEEICRHVLHWSVQVPGLSRARIAFRDTSGHLNAIDSRDAGGGMRVGWPSALCDCHQRLADDAPWPESALRNCAEAEGGEGAFVDHVAVPLVVEGSVVGVLNLGDGIDPDYTESELQAMTTIGRQVSIAFERVRLTRDLEAKVASRTSALEREVADREMAEQAAKLAESRMRDAIDSIDQGLTLYDKDDLLIIFNRGAQSMHPEHDLNHMLGRTFEHVHRANVSSGRFPAALGREESFIAERVRRHNEADGEPMEIQTAEGRWLLTTEHRTSEGGIVVTRTDITKVKQNEHDLEVRERRQIALTELGRHALETASGIGDLLASACEILREQLGVPFAKFLEIVPGDELKVIVRAGTGWNPPNKVVTFERNADSSHIWAAVQLAQPLVIDDWSQEKRFAVPPLLAEQGIASTAALSVAGAEGCWGVFVIHSDEARSFTQDEVSYLQSVVNLVSAAVQASESMEGLRRARDHISGILDSSPAAIATVDSDHKVLTWNASAESMFGYTAAEIVGQAYSILAPEGDRAFGELLDRVMAGETLRHVEIQRRCKDGREISVLFHAKAIHDDSDGFRAAVFSHEDVTERRSIEDQLRQAQKMEAVGQLTGGIAHDFNNILAVTMGNLQLLERRLEGDPQLFELAHDGVEAAQRGADLTRQLLAFSRRGELNPEVTDVNHVVSNMDRLVRRTLGETVQVATELHPDLWATSVDPGQLESALLNLCINARDAMPEGGRLVIETSNTSLDEDYCRSHHNVSPGAYVMIAVSDTGVGMPAEVRERIFEPFFTTKSVGRGTGLGLSMVFGFVNQSRGHVNVYSEQGQGTTFKIYLPRSIDGDAKSADVHQGDEQGNNGTETILLVEDDDAVRRTTNNLLRELGYNVLTAENGQQALFIIKARSDIDLLFSDVVMPGGMMGPELANEAVKIRPHLKVVLTSGYPRNAIQPGDHFELVTKPCPNDELARRLREVLES